MSDQPEDEANDGLRERLQKQGEDALGQSARQLLESPLIPRARPGAFDAREKAAQAQEAAMGALNLPSAADLERLTRRVRSLSQRLEGIEDGVDRLDERLAALNSGGVEQRLAGIESPPDKLANEGEAGRQKLPPRPPRPAQTSQGAPDPA